MDKTINFSNQFLLALPQLEGGPFHQSVVYIAQHNEEGAMGMIVNRTMMASAKELFKQLKIETDHAELKKVSLLFGGPVQTDHGFVIHSPIGNWKTSMSITDNMGITTSTDVLKAIAKGEGPEKFIITLGYAGWDSGQLEKEVFEDNAWLTIPPDETLIFDTPYKKRWQHAANIVGIKNHHHISPGSGNA